MSVAVNDRFMLPRRVRTMEQMADLLQVEQTELTQLQRTIAALENQLFIPTSTFLIPRYERMFALPVSSEESPEVRRARVLAKLNTNGTTTVEAIKEMVKIVTGRDSDVVEYFDQYSFSVIISLLFTDTTVHLFELVDQIEEVKPAHLVFDMVGAFEPTGMTNENHLSFAQLEVLSRFSNARGAQVMRFDGTGRFDGVFLFNQAQTGIQFPDLAFATQFQNREALSGTVLIDSWYTFGGSVAFDGSRKFNAQLTEEEL